MTEDRGGDANWEDELPLVRAKNLFKSSYGDIELSDFMIKEVSYLFTSALTRFG